MEIEDLKKIIEGALLATGAPLSIAQLNALFDEDEAPSQSEIKQALAALDMDLADRAVELVEVGSGYRIQVRTSLMPRVARLWAEKPPKYSRALLETLAVIAYRQPITRAEIEEIRGVSLSSNILRTLQERDWIKIIGHRDVPGRPELLGTTRAFLDYFNRKSLNELPTLAEIKDLADFEPELALNDPETYTERPAGEIEGGHEAEDRHEPKDQEMDSSATDSELTQETPADDAIEDTTTAQS